MFSSLFNNVNSCNQRRQKRRSRMALPCLVILILLSSCARQSALKAVAVEELPFFLETRNYATLLTAAKRHLHYLNSMDPVSSRIEIGGINYPHSWYIRSLTTFIQLIEKYPNPLQLNRAINDTFYIYKAAGRSNNRQAKVLVTGYYEPLFAGNLKRTSTYSYPLYRVPDNLQRQTDPQTAERLVGTLDEQGEFVPYFSRAEIEKEGILAGTELAYLRDPFDAFLLHVQGSGRLQLPNGSTRSIGFAGHNGHPYNSIGKLLVDEDKITLQEASIPVIRRYLTDHPEELERVLHHNPRYIFFRFTDNGGPQGSLGLVLTPERSVAIDQQTLPKELFCYIMTKQPWIAVDGSIGGWQTMGRFALPQDSGAAIKGGGRVDFFWGSGDYAEIAASHMREEGELYFFIEKGL